MLKLCRTGTRTGLTLFMALALVFAGAYLPGKVLAVGVAPDLLTADSYAVIAYSTVTNTGNSIISGDLGLHPLTSVTGFPPGVVVNGTMHVADAAALQAKTDATAAYVNLMGQTPDTTYASGQDLGGLTLGPGVYHVTGSAGLTGILTLDAQDDPDSVFVFQIDSTFITASNSSVVVINAPPDFCNKFWAVGTSATLGTGSVVQGTIIANESITLNTGAALYGRAFALTAAVTLDTNGVTVPCQSAEEPVSPPFTLEIFKFNDLNDNGIYEPLTEFPLADWQFNVVDSGATPLAGNPYTTDEFGFIVIPGLAADDYTVTEVLQPGWTLTTPNNQVVTVSASHGERAVFGNRLAEGTLAIFKFNDVNGDGIYDPLDGDAPLSGWQYDVTGTGGPYSGSTGTDGFLLFTGLALGDYEVTETVQLSWGVTTGNPQTATLSAGGGTVVRFGNLQLAPGTLEIFKFNDLDGDGVYDPLDGETPLSGWAFGVEGPGGPYSGSTDANGLYTLTNLGAGLYTATETVKVGWSVTTLNPQTAELDAEGGARLNFGNQFTFVPPSSSTMPVGGEASPVNKVGLLMPWLIVLAVVAGVAVVAKRRLHSDR